MHRHFCLRVFVVATRRCVDGTASRIAYGFLMEFSYVPENWNRIISILSMSRSEIMITHRTTGRIQIPRPLPLRHSATDYSPAWLHEEIILQFLSPHALHKTPHRANYTDRNVSITCSFSLSISFKSILRIRGPHNEWGQRSTTHTVIPPLRFYRHPRLEARK